MADNDTLTVAELRQALQRTPLFFQTAMYAHGMKGWVIFAPDLEDPVEKIMNTIREDRGHGTETH